MMNSLPNAHRITTRQVLMAMLGFIVGVPISLAVVIWFTRSNLPPLTEAVLATAEARWQAAAVTDYSLEIAIGGKRAGVVKLTVRDGKPISMMRDGVTPKRTETWNAWTIAGMFDTLHLELELAAHPERGFGASDPQMVVQRCEFDELGYPRRYQRSVLGTDNELEWRVVKFTRD